MTDNLMDGLFSEMDRVRELIKQYEDPILNGAGTFAAVLMKQSIANAGASIKNDDVVQMLHCYSKLKRVVKLTLTSTRNDKHTTPFR